ncbi:putative protein isoform X3 [Capsicum galapagoense]
MMMIWEISWCRNGWPLSLRCLFRFHLRGSTSNASTERNDSIISAVPKKIPLRRERLVADGSYTRIPLLR